MGYLDQFWRKPGNPKIDHDKAWKRAQATAWDDKWQALSVDARWMYFEKLKPPASSIAAPQPGTLLDNLSGPIVDELATNGFVKVEKGVGKRGTKVIAVPATHDFSLRLRALGRYKLLGSTDRSLLTNYVKYAFHNQGLAAINGVLHAIEVDGLAYVDEALELYVTSGQWPEWTLKAIKTKSAEAVLKALQKANGPVKLADLPGLFKASESKSIPEALTDLIAHLAVFEDLKPDTLEIIVGLLPIVRERQGVLAQADRPMPLEVCEKPREIGPPGGLALNDLRVFLLEVAGEGPRLKQDGSIFAKEEPRFQAAFPPLPDWLIKLLKLSPERRLYEAFQQARSLGFTESDREEKASWLRLSGRGKKWLSSGIEDQYIKFYETFRENSKSSRYNDFDDDFDDDYRRPSYYLDTYGDSRFFGVSVSVHRINGKNPRHYNYYSTMSDEVRKALRESVRKAFESLPVGVFYRWENVLTHLCSAKANPLNLGGDPAKLIVFVNQRQVPRLPEPMMVAARVFLETFLMQRLLPFDAVRPAIDDQGKLCIARLPRFEGYFGRPYDPGQDEVSTASKVIVQPDFSVLVIGLDPAPAVEIAPFCDRSGGHAGQGALTFKITRESVVRAVTQGLNAKTIIARLTKYASVDIPPNVTSEIEDWAGWIRLVNVRPVMVIRCPDSTTVARVVSALGKKAERLGETLVALHTPNLGSAERQKLQDQGILITKQDITIVASTPPAVPSTVAKAPATASKQRGRPKKAR